MDTTILQVPVSKELRNLAVKASERQGFSSLQEAVRVFLSQFAQSKVEISFTPAASPLSEKNEKRYARMLSAVGAGKVKTKKFSNTDDLMRHLAQ